MVSFWGFEGFGWGWRGDGRVARRHVCRVGGPTYVCGTRRAGVWQSGLRAMRAKTVNAISERQRPVPCGRQDWGRGMVR